MMTSLSNLGIGLSLVFSLLLLALIAELYYLLWWKKKKRVTINEDIQDDYSSSCSSSSSAREFLYLFCWKKPSSLSSTGLFTDPEQENHQLHLHSSSSKLNSFGEDSIEAELMRLHNLSGPPRLLFTIKEETKEDLESEDGRSRNNNNKTVSRRSLADLLLVAVETPFLTPVASPRLTPPLTPIHYSQNGVINPLFESSVDPEMYKIIRPSPSPKFKFLKDAEDKFSRRRLIEEALKRVQRNAAVSPMASKGEDGSFTITVDKHKEGSEFDHCHHQNAVPLSSSPSPSTVKSSKH